MARLYAVTSSATDIAAQFEVATPSDVRKPPEVVEGMSGPIVVEREGTRLLIEWGPVYTGVMRNANDAIKPIHDRMPVLLNPEDYETWLHGTFDDAVALQDRVYPSELITIDRTLEPWNKRKPKAEEAAALGQGAASKLHCGQILTTSDVRFIID